MNEANSPTVARCAMESSHCREHVRDGRGERLGDVLAHVEAAQGLGALPEAPRLVVLPAEYLHHFLALDRLLQHRHQIAERALRLPRHAAQAHRDAAHDPGDQGPDRERDQGELPVQVQQPRQQADHGDRVLDDDGEDRRRRTGDSRDVVRHLGEDGTGRIVVEEAGRKAHQAREHRGTQVEHDLVGHPVHAVRRGKRENAAHEEDADDGAGEYRRRVARLSCGKAAVEQRLDERRKDRLGRRGEHHAEHGEREDPAVRAHVAQQAAVGCEALLLSASGHAFLACDKGP
jgi:hypothetical protein